MTRIDSSQALAALIQQRLVERSVRRAASGVNGKPQTGEMPPGPKDIGSHIAQRIRAIEGSYPERRRKAFRIFLEATLSADLGSDLINDSAFFKLVEEVHESMERDRDLQAVIDTAADELLRLASQR